MMTEPKNVVTVRERIETSGRFVRANPAHGSIDSVPTERDEKPRNAEDLPLPMFIHLSPAAAKDIRSRFLDKSMWPRP